MRQQFIFFFIFHNTYAIMNVRVYVRVIVQQNQSRALVPIEIHSYHRVR